MENKLAERKTYIIGGGIAGLATAIYLIQEGAMPGRCITILDKLPELGGSLDGAYSKSNKAYITRGFRMFEDNVYSSIFNIMARIPSTKNPEKTLFDEFTDFNARVHTHADTRLIDKGKRIDPHPLQLRLRDRLAMLNFLVASEKSFGKKTIQDYFTHSFFDSDFWFEMATVYSFQPWHRVTEFRRYIIRFLQDAPVVDTLDCIRSTPYNQYDSIIEPIVLWLKKNEVHFKTSSIVTDIDFRKQNGKKVARAIHYTHKKTIKKIMLEKDDLVFATLGSMTANSCYGSTNSAPQMVNKKSDSWSLWETLAKKDPAFGNPKAFTGQKEKSRWTSFTMTFRDPVFFKLIKKFTRHDIGTEGLITFKDSNWLITLCIPAQPHFKDQPDNIQVAWAYGLFSDKKGNVVQKKMHQCTGKELLTELLYHLKINKEKDKILETTACIPCFMPYITSQFLPVSAGDRPEIIPNNTKNFAIIGQYCEIPDDIVFTVEYSARSAQIAVYSLLNIQKSINPIFKGRHHPKIVIDAVKTAFR